MFTFLKSLTGEAIVKAVLIITTIVFAFSELAFKTSDALQPIINGLS